MSASDRIFDVFGCLIANGLMSERECVAVIGADAMRRGVKADKAALARGIASRLGKHLQAWERNHTTFCTDASDVILSMVNRRRPSSEILRAVHRLNYEWADGLPVLSPADVNAFVAEEIAMVLVRKKSQK